MIISYDKDDLNKWASISNDYNPIHFDGNYAKAFGLDDVVAHGMLGINDILRYLELDSDKATSHINCILKKPLPLNTKLLIEKNGSKIKLVNPNNGNVLFRTKVGSYDEWQEIPYSDELVEIDNIHEKLSELDEIYNNSNKLWISLNSIVFSEYISRNSGNVLAKEIADWKKENDDYNENKELMVMHTNHNIHLHKDIINITSSSQVEEVHYNVYGKDFIKSKDRIYGLLQFDVWINRMHLMIIEMGLIAIKT